MTDIADVTRLVALEGGLSVVTTLRADTTMQASVVNAGVLSHPVHDTPVVGFVARGSAHKLANLRARPHATLVLRAGWQWIALEGRAEIIGPDDPAQGVDPAGLAGLLRQVFTAAGGSHDDWAAYDRAMAEERRAAVLITPGRIYSNAASA